MRDSVGEFGAASAIGDLHAGLAECFTVSLDGKWHCGVGVSAQSDVDDKGLTYLGASGEMDTGKAEVICRFFSDEAVV